MKCISECKEEEKSEFVNGLYKFFIEADVNETHKLDWETFIQYVFDVVMANQTKSDKGEVQSQTEMFDLAPSEGPLKFSQSAFKDLLVHEGLIQKVTYSAKFNRLILIETKSHLIKFISPLLQEKEIIDLFNRQNDMCKTIERPLINRAEVKYFVIATAYDEVNQIVNC